MKIYLEKDIKNFDQRYRVNFINSLSGFKSANLIGTTSSSKQTNLSIISSAFHLGADPALIGFINRPETKETRRHTLDNIRENGHYTINHVHSNIIEQAHHTSARYPREVSEFSAAKLTEDYINDFKAPFVKESLLKIAMKLTSINPIKENNTLLIIGKIEFVVLEENITSEDGYINIEDINSVCVSGLDTYHITNKLKRLAYAKPLIH
jgi:flavin reductase (DIM6/NTAB) family NADH-FMN oxidoreductase RutF